jgi:hypothetical protein
MASTPWYPARLARASLLVGALAVVLLVPAAAAHVACEHADHATADPHQCAVCRHLGDGTPLPATGPAVASPAPVAPVTAAPDARAASLVLPPAHGRSPPVHVSMS